LLVAFDNFYESYGRTPECMGCNITYILSMLSFYD
jgi:hypothetical protein